MTPPYSYLANTNGPVYIARGQFHPRAPFTPTLCGIGPRGYYWHKLSNDLKDIGENPRLCSKCQKIAQTTERKTT